MTDERETELQSAASAAAAVERERQKQEPKRSLWGLLGIVVLVIIVILVLLLLRDCGRSGKDDAATGGKTIEIVEGLDPVPGIISVWIKPGAKIEQVVSAAKVDGDDFIDMGGGRFVVQVPKGQEESSAGSIAKLDSVYDAGLVYSQEASEGATAP